MLRYCLVVFIGHHPEPDTSGLEKTATATSNELEFSSRESCFSRPDVLGSDSEQTEI